jgi:hypothetical protein
MLRRPQDRRDNILITGTSAKITAQVLAYLCFGWRRILAQQLIDRHQKTGGAKAALKAKLLQKSLLNRMQALATFRQTGQSLDGQDLSSVCLNGEEKTRADGFAIKENRAAATDSLLATQMRSGKPKMVAQEVSYRQAWLDNAGTRFTVDGQRYGKLARHHRSFFETAIGFLLG